MYTYKNVQIKYLGHAGFLIKGDGKTIVIDPYKVKVSEPADIVICTHDHFDHCSPPDIRFFVKDSTVLVVPPNCKSKVAELPVKEVKVISAGESVEINGVKIEAVPAYNVDKPYHPKEYGGIGVVVTVAGVRIYHAGDTDFIPEMRDLKDIDIALLPVSGVYVMTASDAVKAVEAIKPKVAIPMHYGVVAGTRRDAIKFKEKASKICEVVILEVEK